MNLFGQRATTFILSLLVSAQLIDNTLAQGDALVQPQTIDSSGGVLDTTLTLEYADFSGPHYTFTNTRLLNGVLPGPTLRLEAGDTLRINFQNQLSVQSGAVSSGDNEYHNPDHSNLHFHGGHVSGELPSDDIRMSVAPGDSYQYETLFPSNHMPGTHWIHPHVHGSSALQVGAGAAMAMIVKDPDGYLPSQVEDAEDVLLFVQNINRGSLDNVITDIGDSMLEMDFDRGSENQFRVVNGQYQPEVSMQPGEWQRWRIVYGNWLVDSLNFQFDSGSDCEMHLLAKDGVYLQDYPRAVSILPIPTGGRADVMVRCGTAGTETVIDFDGNTLLTVSVSGNEVSSSTLEAWAPTLPAYLSDLTSTTADNGCDCRTSFGRCDDDDDKFCVNQNLFDADVYVHTVAFGSVVERELRGISRHPYHQHVYPFQLVDGLDGLDDTNGEATYFHVGDWHDVVLMDTDDTVVMRYQADVHDGVIMLHCHILTHEDLGTMSQELVIDGGSCECDALYEEPGSDDNSGNDNNNDNSGNDNNNDNSGNDNNNDNSGNDNNNDNSGNDNNNDDDCRSTERGGFSSLLSVISKKYLRGVN